MMEKIKTFFKNKKNYYRILYSIIIIYLTVIIIFKIKTSYELQDRGVYSIAKIVEITPGSYASRYIKYEFICNGKPRYGYHSFQAWQEGPVIGKYYLSIYLQDKVHLNYLFMETQLPDDIDLYSNPKNYVPATPPYIKFWKI